MSTASHAVVFSQVGKSELREIRIPDPEEGEVLVRCAYSLVSPGTEFRCLDGLQVGTSGFPFIPGYSASGVVMKSRKAGVEEGQLVMTRGTERAEGMSLMWGGHVSHAVTSKVFPMPPGADLLCATMSKLAGISRRGPIVCAAKPGETVAVVGLGPIGQLSARIFHLLGCETVAFDPVPGRTALAREGGVEAIEVGESLPDTVRNRFPGGARIVVDCTGVPALLDQAVLCAADKPWEDTEELGARVLVQGSYPAAVTLDYNQAFRREVGIVFPRDSRDSDLAETLAWILDGTLPVRELIGKVFSPSDASTAYPALRENRNWATIAFDWSLA